jgi:DNA-binding CsgD family transcriptional regulator
VPSAWPLAARDIELRAIIRALGRRDGAPGLVLAGPPGVGKTRLATEALAAEARRGRLTRWAAATESARAIPLGALAHLLQAEPGPIDGPRFLRAAVDTLRAGSQGAGLVVGVDDAHLLDDLSATLVHQLVLGREAAVVVTIRSGAGAPDPIVALWKDGLLERLEVAPLGLGAARELLEGALSGPVETVSIERLWRTSGGNVLLLRHLVDEECEAGRLHRIDGIWVWRGSPAVGSRLGELLSRQLGQLSPPVRSALELLAYAEPLEVEVLTRLAGSAAVETAERRGLLTVASGSGIGARLGHPLYGEVLRAGMSSMRADRVRTELAQALVAHGSHRPDDALRLAVLRQGGAGRADPYLFTVAAQRANELLDPVLAERLARSAVAAEAGFEARLTLAYALSWQGRIREADRELAALGELAATDRELSRAAIPRVAGLYWGVGAVDDAEVVLRGVEAVVTDEVACQQLAGLRAAMAFCAGRPVESAGTAAGVLASPAASGLSRVWAISAMVPALAVLGRADQAADLVDRAATSTAWTTETAFLRYGGKALGDVLALELAGRLDEAQRRAEWYHGQAMTEPHHTATALTSLLLGRAHLARGRVATAVRWLREALVGWEQYDPAGWRYCSLIGLTQALGMAGDADGAGRALAEVTAARHPGLSVWEPEHLLATAWTAAAEGALTKAVELAGSAAREAAASGQLAVEVHALGTAARLGDGSGAGRLRTLAGLVDGPRASLATDHAQALAARNGAALDRVSTGWEAIGADLAAADAAAQAAIHHRRADRPAVATASAARAHALATACEGARTPALSSAARPLPVTAREREVAVLAAHGLSNQEIADRLVVSVRTVEGHLHKAYSKLHVHDRAELASLLTPGGP